MENESFGQRVAKTTKKIVRRIIIAALVIGVAVFAFLYWGVYESGIMAGKVLRVTEKGMLFKTYEVKLNLETFGALKGASPIASSFDFSVEGHQKEVIKDLEQVALSGERVNLHFIKRYYTFPWRGDSKYFIERVEKIK